MLQEFLLAINFLILTLKLSEFWVSLGAIFRRLLTVFFLNCTIVIVWLYFVELNWKTIKTTWWFKRLHICFHFTLCYCLASVLLDLMLCSLVSFNFEVSLFWCKGCQICFPLWAKGVRKEQISIFVLSRMGVFYT